MNRNENEAESFAGNFMAFGEEALFFEVPLNLPQVPPHACSANFFAVNFAGNNSINLIDC
jgi:hypothetical protein